MKQNFKHLVERLYGKISDIYINEVFSVGCGWKEQPCEILTDDMLEEYEKRGVTHVNLKFFDENGVEKFSDFSIRELRIQ